MSRTLPAVAVVAAIGAILLWAGLTPAAVLRGQLRDVTFWWLEIQVALVGVSAFLAVREARTHLAASRRQYALVLGTGVMALVLSSSVAPRTSRIFYDEQIYQGVGQNLSDLHLAQMCNDGTVEYGRLQCWSGEYNKQPNAYPHLLSLLYRIGGVKPQFAHWLNSVTCMLLVWVAFCTATLFFGNPTAGCFAAGLMATIPMQLSWGNTAAVEPTAELAMFTALASSALFVRARSTVTLLLLVATTVYACSFRPESVLVIAPVGLCLVLFCPSDLARPATLWVLALGVLLAAPAVAHLASVGGERWGADGARMGFEHVARNLRSNTLYYLLDERFPVLYTALALAGAAAGLFRGNWRSVAVLGTAFLAFAGVYLVFYAGSYDYGADVRYSLLTFPPLVVLGGAGASWIAAALSRWTRRAGAAVVGLLLVVNLLWYMPVVRATGEEAWAARADVSFAKSVRPRVSANSVVLTHNPSLFHVMGVNAAQASLATTDAEYLETELFDRYPGRVYFHWGYWCNVADPVQTGFCDQVLRSFDVEPVAQYRERDYRYALYRLSHKAPTGKP